LSAIAGSPAALINLALYPIDDLSTPAAQALVARCRRELVETGSCSLHDFLAPDALAQMVEEAREVAPLAHWEGRQHGSPYLIAPDETRPEGHPLRRTLPSSVRAVAGDLVKPHHALRRLYEWDGMLAFIEAVVNRGTVYRYADPLGAINVAVMKDGDNLMWHFDQTDFVTSLLLQSSEAGGQFDYVPFIRSREAENFDRVGRLLDGDESEVVRVEARPGTFAFFEGRYSIHRVTTVEGPTERLIGLFGYDTKPGTMSSDRLKLRRYGRVA